MSIQKIRFDACLSQKQDRRRIKENHSVYVLLFIEVHHIILFLIVSKFTSESEIGLSLAWGDFLFRWG